ncbi:FAD-dependent oxidoreductase [Microbacterium sp. AZCO]|uniref:NAD(P)/FAD-dependent oxidoreductase n=1 Tax=Microbacterium sp. AZCO TaxID=3142976 RepID=UPI0031F36EBB
MAHYVIVGGGLAAGTAVEKLRDEGFDGDLTVVAAEQHPPYQRPPLSKGFLAGEEGRDAVILHDAAWYEEKGVGLRTGVTATSLEPAGQSLALDDGSTLTYDALLLATGSSPRRLPLDGADLEGVRTLRTLDDSDALAAELRGGGRRLVLIGSGWIGMEVAATAKTLGNEVTVLERGRVPLEAALGEDMGAVFRDLHLEKGVDLRASVQVERIAGAGRVSGVFVDGEEIPADLVVIGVGAVPNVSLAERAGIDVDNGIVVDERLRTDASNIFAAGDVANAYHPVIQRHLRSEHWDNALKAGEVAARSMLGMPASHDSIPYFYTDQFDLGMELSGYPPLMKDARVVTRGDVATREFIAFWHDGTRIVGAMNVNVWDVQEQLQRLIRDAAPVTADALRDGSIALNELAP